MVKIYQLLASGYNPLVVYPTRPTESTKPAPKPTKPAARAISTHHDADKSGTPQQPTTFNPPIKNCLAFGRAILWQAFRDIQANNGQATEAAAWLYGSDLARAIMGAMDLPREKLPDAIDAVLDGARLSKAGRW